MQTVLTLIHFLVLSLTGLTVSAWVQEVGDSLNPSLRCTAWLMSSWWLQMSWRQAINNHLVDSSMIKEYHSGPCIISRIIQIALQSLNKQCSREFKRSATWWFLCYCGFKAIMLNNTYMETATCWAWKATQNVTQGLPGYWLGWFCHIITVGCCYNMSNTTWYWMKHCSDYVRNMYEYQLTGCALNLPPR